MDYGYRVVVTKSEADSLRISVGLSPKFGSMLHNAILIAMESFPCQ
jgi:hypothetical protein